MNIELVIIQINDFARVLHFLIIDNSLLISIGTTIQVDLTTVLLETINKLVIVIY